MAVSTTAVGAAPVRVVAGATRILVENLGRVPLRFVVGAAAGELAPSARSAGHLLLPGRRVTVRVAAATYPLWVWAPKATVVGVSTPFV